MIQEAYTYVEKTPAGNLDVKLKLIDTLRTVTTGKVSYKYYYNTSDRTSVADGSFSLKL